MSSISSGATWVIRGSSVCIPCFLGVLMDLSSWTVASLVYVSWIDWLPDFEAAGEKLMSTSVSFESVYFSRISDLAIISISSIIFSMSSSTAVAKGDLLAIEDLLCFRFFDLESFYLIFILSMPYSTKLILRSGLPYIMSESTSLESSSLMVSKWLSFKLVSFFFFNYSAICLYIFSLSSFLRLMAASVFLLGLCFFGFSCFWFSISSIIFSISLSRSPRISSLLLYFLSSAVLAYFLNSNFSRSAISQSG